MEPVLLVLASCSDYNLDGRDDHDGKRDPSEDSTPLVTDSGATLPTGDDSGGTTIPGTTTDIPAGKLDVVLLMDDAYFYDCYRADLHVRTDELVAALFATGLDVAIALATYDDYQVSGTWYAGDGGLPYVLEQQLTTDRSRLDAVASGLAIEWGGDWQGSGYEALAQTARGAGFDQDCDGTFDSTTDVRPFNASSNDAFGGGVTGAANTSVPGTGSVQGVGFRTDSARVIVLFAENGFRSGALGHDTPSGACPGVATAATSASNVTGAKAKLLLVNAYEFQDIDRTLQNQLEELATLTDSRYDADGNGSATDLAVLSGSWDWPATTVLVDAIRQLGEL